MLIPPDGVGKIRNLEDLDARSRRRVKAAEDALVNLTRERMVVFSPQGRIIFLAEGDTHSVSFTPEEGRKLRGQVLTHNHPTGGTFSAADFEVACTYQVKELRAVSGEHVYSATAREGNFRVTQLRNVVGAHRRLLPEPAKLTVEQAHARLRQVAEENGFNYHYLRR